MEKGNYAFVKEPSPEDEPHLKAMVDQIVTAFRSSTISPYSPYFIQALIEVLFAVMQIHGGCTQEQIRYVLEEQIKLKLPKAQ
jgi:hypothetical protein